MTDPRTSLLRHRLRAHGLAGGPAMTPEDLVARFGAIQGEKYEYTKWSIAQRVPSFDGESIASPGSAGARSHAERCGESIERAVADGRIIRTHLLRETWHLVHRDDLRWMQRATGPRLAALAARRYDGLGLTARLRGRSNDVIARALSGGRHLTRTELADALAAAGIEARGQRLANLMFEAEFALLICSGAPRGTAQTYALVDERVPDRAIRFAGDAALAELARRYFSSRGPATVKDFRWWATLTAADAARAIAAAAPALEQLTFDGRTFWRAPAATLPPAGRTPALRLLPMLDEYLVSYTDSRDIAFAVPTRDLSVFGAGGLMNWIVRRGEVIGRWRADQRDQAPQLSVGWLPGIAPATAAELARIPVVCGRSFGLPTIASKSVPTTTRQRRQTPARSSARSARPNRAI